MDGTWNIVPKLRGAKGDAMMAMLTAKTVAVLHLFVIHDRPDDHPGKVVVRAWRVGVTDGTFDFGTLAVTETLPEARRALPPGSKQLRAVRPTFDDGTIAEVWMV